eukprot:7522673-Pyramimonas_sp.AAC.1
MVRGKAASPADASGQPPPKRGKTRAFAPTVGCSCGSCGDKCLPDCSNWAEKELQLDGRNNQIIVPIGPVCEGCASFALIRYVDVATLCKAKQTADEKGKASPYQKDLTEHKAALAHPQAPRPWGQCQVYRETIGGVYTEECVEFQEKEAFETAHG